MPVLLRSILHFRKTTNFNNIICSVKTKKFLNVVEA